MIFKKYSRAKFLKKVLCYGFKNYSKNDPTTTKPIKLAWKSLLGFVPKNHPKMTKVVSLSLKRLKANFVSKSRTTKMVAISAFHGPNLLVRLISCSENSS